MNGKTNLNTWLVVCVFMLTLSGTAAGRAITVDEDGPADYNKIQEAIDAAVAGDTINVASGTYYENVIVNKQLKLVGDDPNAVVIDSGGMGDAVTITAGNIRVEGFTIRNATGNDGCGLRLYNCQQNTIIGNTIVDNSYGIRLDRSSDNTITDNDITSNKGAGISICDSNHTLVSGNRMNANGDFWSSEGFGVVIESSRETQVVNNTLASNCGGIHIKDDSHYNVLRGNVVSSNGGGIVLGEEVYVSRPSDNTVVSNEVTSNDNGIVLVRTSHNAILDNEVSQNSNQGICLQYAPDNTIEDNVVKSNSLDFLDPFACGIYLYRSHSVLITGNKIADNHMFGIFLRDCHDGTIVDNVVKSHKSERGYLGLSGALALDWDSYFNIIRENKIIDNRFGLGVAGRFNKIYRNMFINNEAWNAAAHSSRNSWADESDEPPSGNFWSDYDGADCNSGPDQNIPGTSDGRGDKPYVINEPNNIDYYPLMISYSIAADPCVPIMNEPYTLDVNLTNLLDVDVNFTGAIQVKASPSYASGKLVSRQKGILTPYTIEPNQTAAFKLSFTNDWDWIKPGDCRVIGDLISALSNEFVGWSLVRFIEACYDTRQAVPKVTYTFEPDPNSHPLISFSTRVAVQVPQGKQEALQRSLMLQVLSMSTSLYGLIAGPVSPIFTLTGIVFTVGSIQAYNEAVDPASDYTEIPQPVPMAPPPEIEVLPEGTAKRLALAALELASLQKAYSESYIRYDGARMAGDNEYMERQLTAALKYNDMATEKLQEVQFLSALLTADANMPQLTEDDVLSYRNAVLRDGLSQIQQYVLEQTGLGSVKPDVIQLIRRSTETTEQRQLYTDPNALRKYAHAATQARYIEDYALQATAEAEDLTVQPTRDVAVTSVVPSKTAVCQGESVSINVTVENQGTEPVPGFAVTAYRDSEVIANANFEKDPCGTSFDGISDWNHRSSDQYGASIRKE